MSRRQKLPFVSVWDKNAVLQAFEEGGVKPDNALRMWSYMIRYPEATWNEVEPSLPKKAVQILDKHFKMFTSKLITEQRSESGDTVKLLVEMQDGLQVECVVMTYNTPSVPRGGARGSRKEQEGTGDEKDGAVASAAQFDEEEDVFEDALEDFSGDVDLLRIDGASEEEEENGLEGHDGANMRSIPRESVSSCDGTSAADSHSLCGDAAQTGTYAPSSDSGSTRTVESGPRRAHPATSGAAGGRQRSTVCVSSQVGCQMGCTFCATGTMGLRGNLTCGEIVEQLVHARRVADIQNVVFMGMGEPLMNYDAVHGAVTMMTHSRLFQLRRRKVTLSTVGVVPRIKQLAKDLPGVSLALSLHAPRQDLRQSIVPSARAYKLETLMAAVSDYMRVSGQKVFIEYVMLAGVNDGQREADELGELLRGMNVVVNLIPWNPVLAAASAKEAAAAAAVAFPPSAAESAVAAVLQGEKEGKKEEANGEVMLFDAPSSTAVTNFSKTLQTKYGLHTTVRQEMGQDISGACGQLVVKKLQEEQGGGKKAAVRDIEDLGGSSCGGNTSGTAKGCV